MGLKVAAIMDKDITKYATNPNMMNSEAYLLCVKADALRYSELYQESISKYLRAILIDKTYMDSYLGLARSYKGLKLYDKAIQILEKGLAIEDNIFDFYNEIGICYLVTDRPCLAIKNFIKAIQLDPECMHVQLQLALAHELIGEKEMALMIYQKIIDQDPSFLKAYQHKAALLMTLDSFQEASSTFNSILKINPKYSNALLGIGICFDKLRRIGDAMRYYKKFISKKEDLEHVKFVKERLNTLREKRFSRNNLTLVHK